MTLFKYYSLYEVINRDMVIDILKKLKSEGKINYEIEGDVFRIEDLDLDDTEIENIINIFEENDVFVYLDRHDDDDDDYDIYDYDDYDDY
jgi:hypothetical protein